MTIKRQSSLQWRRFVMAAGVALYSLLPTPVSLGSDRADATEERILRVERGLLPSPTAGVIPAPPWSIQDRMQYYRVPGVSIAVIHNYTLDWARSYGVLEAGSDTPVREDSMFQAASLSKPVTAMGILSLVQQGRLSLDQDINEFLSTWRLPQNEFTTAQHVTAGHLLTHTAGTPAFGYFGYYFDQPVPTLVDILNGQRPPANSPAIRVERVPGTEHVYSNGGFLVLQQLAGDLTGSPFDSWMQSTVLERLEMTHSTFTQPLPRALQPNAARGHSSSGAAIRGGWMIHPEQASSGLWTTATDLARFVIEIQKSYHAGSNRVLSMDMTRLMLTPFVPFYGLGVELASEGALFYHTGANNGYRSLMLGYPHSGDGAVILTNADSGAELRLEIARAIATEYGWAHFRVAGFPAGAPSTPDSVINAASGGPAFAPGSIVSLYGTDLKDVTEVLFQGQSAKILAAGSGQINVIVPASVSPGLALVQVRRQGLTSRAREVRLTVSAPGIFTWTQRGDGPGVIVHADTFRLVTDEEPARPGEYLSILCTGLGPGPSQLQVSIGDVSAPVVWGGPMPNFPGVDQINIQLPTEAPRGPDVPVQIRSGSSISNLVTVAVR